MGNRESCIDRRDINQVMTRYPLKFPTRPPSFFLIYYSTSTLPIACITNCQQNGNAYRCVLQVLLPAASRGHYRRSPQSRITFIARRHFGTLSRVFYCRILIFFDSEKSPVVRLSFIQSLSFRFVRDEWIAYSFSVVYPQLP